MKTTVRKIGLGLAFVLCFVITKSQTSTFVKTIVVNINNKVELTDLSGQALKKGALYRVQLAVVSTGTRTGAEYLVWYDNATKWVTRLVTVNGTTSNHPTLEIIDDVVKVATQHTSNYSIRAFVACYDSGNQYAVPTLFGASYHWQRNVGQLYYLDGNVGIGTSTPSDKLSVNGNIRAKEIKVEATNWPDYVFAKGYDLKPLSEVERHIQENGHLPDVPKADMVEEEGISVGEMNKIDSDIAKGDI